MCSKSPSDQPRPSARHAAGTDPAKRSQIMAGAWSVFLEHGFDAASMNQICKAAGVSKSTLYVYFNDKQDLFVALIEARSQAFLIDIRANLTQSGTQFSRLLAAALSLSRLITSVEVIRVQRIVISVADRMPDLIRRFYEAGAENFLKVLADWLAAENAASRMVVPDPDLAAHQFAELVTAGLWRKQLLGYRGGPPAPADIEAVARAGVGVFLAAYGRGPDCASA
ncbi:TetR/AcrR family transcriptional regulator [Rhodobacteraceae bacterium]|nr:TetR/AcrR family transcriptional regulator [Paracoccaceae bacterium]